MAETGNGVHGEDRTTFEQSFKRLQEAVQKLSEGNLTLQEALATFEEGMLLADRCTQMLDSAELRLRQVSAGTTRAAGQSAGDLEELVRQSGVSAGEDGELVAFELTTVESTTVLDRPGPASLRVLPGSGATGKAGRAEPEEKSDDFELDPLFDEDD